MSGEEICYIFFIHNYYHIYNLNLFTMSLLRFDKYKFIINKIHKTTHKIKYIYYLLVNSKYLILYINTILTKVALYLYIPSKK